MRQLAKNKVKMWYALHRASEVIYKLDKDGNKIVSYVDTSVTPPVTYYEEEGTTEEGYYEPVEFFGNIAYSGGDSQVTEFGISTADYEANVTVSRNSLPITEQSLIYLHTPLVDSSGYAKEEDADYRVIRVHPTINEDKFLLSKVQK